MKLREIIYDIKTIISHGKLVDDSIWDNRLIAHWIDNQRALWLTNDYNKNRAIRNNEMQTLNLVNMQVVDGSRVRGFDSGTKLLMSMKKIPRVLQPNSHELCVLRGLDILQAHYNHVTREEAIYSGNGMFNQEMLYFFLFEDRVWIKYGKQSLRTAIPTKVSLEGVFESPLEVDTFNETYDNIWNGIDDYPISRKFIDYLKKEILTLDTSSLLQYPKDNNPNDEHDNSQGKAN